MNLLDFAVKTILEGNLVAIPTETVYGLAGDARNEIACRKIFELKKRPNNNPLIVHVASLEQAMKIATFNNDAIRLSSLWPGPITMVLPKNPNVHLAYCVTAGLPTVAIRIPLEPTALEFLRRCCIPVAAPSANVSGYLSPTTASHVERNFLGEKLVILPRDLRLAEHDNNSRSRYGLESTIVDLSTEIPVILRHGPVPKEEIELLLGKSLLSDLAQLKVIAPGMMHKHYSPCTPIRIDATDVKNNEVGLAFGKANLVNPYNCFMLNLSNQGDLSEAARHLFSMLYELDEYAMSNRIKAIAVGHIPHHGIGIAINDRLYRGAA